MNDEVFETVLKRHIFKFPCNYNIYSRFVYYGSGGLKNEKRGTRDIVMSLEEHIDFF